MVTELLVLFRSGTFFLYWKDFLLPKELGWQHVYSLSSLDRRFLVLESSWRPGGGRVPISHMRSASSKVTPGLINQQPIFKEAKPV